MKIAEKHYVAIDYKLTLDTGEEVDKSQEGQPLGFITGGGQMIPGLEKALMGMQAGENASFTVEPEEGYGPVRQDLLQDIPKDQFPADVKVEPGMSFQAHGPQGPLMLLVKSVNDNDTVSVDLNHPLAGKRLCFDVNVVEVREPSADELAQFSAAAGCGCGCGSESQGACGPDSCAPDGCGPGCNCG